MDAIETELDVMACRRQFPALERTNAGGPVVYLDGPAGSQTPRRVAEAVAHYLLTTNANHGGVFATARESDDLLREAHRAGAEFVGAADPGEIVFGANMTTLTLGLSRAIARSWTAGDEVLVTRLDHDANVTPWALAARDAGAIARTVEFRDDCSLDMESFHRQLSPRTRLVAIGCASNAVGTINAVAEMARAAHAVGALVYADAVHYAPHRLIDVAALECDFVVCSAYKFFGPHVGVLWGKRELLERFTPYKVRPAANQIPDRWMTGTQSHEGIAGFLAAVDYLADLGRSLKPRATSATHARAAASLPLATGSCAASDSSRRGALVAAYAAIRRHEESLSRVMLAGLAALPRYRTLGIADAGRIEERVATFGVTHSRRPAREVALHLAERGIFAWHGNFYALSLSERLGLEPEGMVRLGLLHYNTREEVDRALAALAELD